MRLNEVLLSDIADAQLFKAKIEVLKEHIEHPNKPGYKRSDVVNKIKSLEFELSKIQKRLKTN